MNGKTTQRLLEFVPDDPPLFHSVLLRLTILTSLSLLEHVQQIPLLAFNAGTNPDKPTRYNLSPSSSRLV